MDEKLQVLMEKAYDKFRFRLSNVVVCMAEDVKTALGSVTVADSPLHILKPTGLDIQLHKSSIDDLRLPKWVHYLCCCFRICFAIEFTGILINWRKLVVGIP